jgi:hypothetical protein
MHQVGSQLLSVPQRQLLYGVYTGGLSDGQSTRVSEKLSGGQFDAHDDGQSARVNSTLR